MTLQQVVRQKVREILGEFFGGALKKEVAAILVVYTEEQQTLTLHASGKIIASELLLRMGDIKNECIRRGVVVRRIVIR